MKNIILFLTVLIISSCATLTKFELPNDLDTISYSRQDTSSNKQDNYKNIMREIYILSPKCKTKTEPIINNSQSGSIFFQLTAYSEYDYPPYTENPKHKRHFSYLLTCEITDTNCKLTVNNITIVNSTLEQIYFNDSPHNIRKFNLMYEDIDSRIKSILITLGRAVN